jgi:hypothetical protein
MAGLCTITGLSGHTWAIAGHITRVWIAGLARGRTGFAETVLCGRLVEVAVQKTDVWLWAGCAVVPGCRTSIDGDKRCNVSVC